MAFKISGLGYSAMEVMAARVRAALLLLVAISDEENVKHFDAATISARARTGARGIADIVYALRGTLEFMDAPPAVITLWQSVTLSESDMPRLVDEIYNGPTGVPADDNEKCMVLEQAKLCLGAQCEHVHGAECEASVSAAALLFSSGE